MPRPRDPSSCSSCFCSSCSRLPSHHSISIATYPRKTERRGQLPQSISQQVDAVLGLRYNAMLLATDLSDLPSSARAVINDSRYSFITADRGHVRRHNDSALASRAGHFSGWLDVTGFTVDHIRTVGSDNFPSLLAAYVTAVAAGNNLTSITTLGDAALRGHMAAACDAISMLTS
jgi:hypothetical protein